MKGTAQSFGQRHIRVTTNQASDVVTTIVPVTAMP